MLRGETRLQRSGHLVCEAMTKREFIERATIAVLTSGSTADRSFGGEWAVEVALSSWDRIERTFRHDISPESQHSAEVEP